MEPRLYHHFHANEDQHQRQTVAKITQVLEQVREQKVQRTKTQNRKDVGSVNDERITRDTEDRRDGIHRERNIADFNDEQDQQQWRSEQLPRLPNEKAGPVILLAHPKMGTGEPEDEVAFVMHLLPVLPDHVQSGINQEHAENGKNPVETGNQDRPGGDHDAAHNQRAQNAPCEHAMLHVLVHLKRPENHQEDKKIVDAEGFLNHISSKVLQPSLRTMPMPHEKTEPHSQPDPHYGPESGLPNSDFVGFSMKYA